MPTELITRPLVSLRASRYLLGAALTFGVTAFLTYNEYYGGSVSLPIPTAADSSRSNSTPAPTYYDYVTNSSRATDRAMQDSATAGPTYVVGNATAAIDGAGNATRSDQSPT